MIDQSYQAEIDRNLDDQQRRTEGVPLPTIPLWQNLGASILGMGPSGLLKGGASFADLSKGDAEVMAATQTSSSGGMFLTPTDDEQKQIDAANDKMMKVGVDFSSETGTAMRVKAKAFMPDPQSTGKAAQIVGSLGEFAVQAMPSALAGPPGLVALGTARGMQKAEDLKDQGVDPATRMLAGTVSGTLDAGSMVLPMTGATRLIAAGKGAAGGVATGIAQSEVEKLILQHAGYSSLASTYDPFDPVSLVLSGLVPAAFGGLHAPTPRAGAAARAAHPEASQELAAAQAAADAAINSPDRIGTLEAEIAKPETTPESRAALQAEIDRIRSQPPAPLDANVEAAARVQQAAEALDASRLTPDDDLVGRDQHQQAVERASDQIARGESVDVTDIVGDPEANFARWFGESVIRDEQGNPRVMYHGSAQDFDSFAPRQANAVFVGDHPIIAEAYAQQSAKWMSDHGQEGAPSIAPLFVKAEHPFDYENPAHVEALAEGLLGKNEGPKSQIRTQVERLLREGDWDLIESPETQAAIRALGHDAFYVNESGFKNLGVYDPRNLKSAIGNSGSFDPLSGSLTDPIKDLAHAAQQIRAAREIAEPAGKSNRAAFDEAEAGAAQPKGSGGEPRPGETGAKASADAIEPSRLEAAVQQVLKTDPDMMVQLDGMERPMRISELLDAVREQGADEIRDAKLLEVAAQCFIGA